MEVPLTAELLLFQLVCLSVNITLVCLIVNIAVLHYFGRYRTQVLPTKFLFAVVLRNFKQVYIAH